MHLSFWISILVFVLIVIVALIIVAIALRRSRAGDITGNQAQQLQGYWISIGMSIGAGFGVALGLVFDNLAIGIAVGTGFGLTIGSALEQRNKDKTRPLTEKERRLQIWGLGLGLLVLFVVVGLFVFLQFLE